MPVLRNLLKTLTPPARERPGEWVQHPDYFVGKEALARDDAAAARDAFLRVLAERPDQLDARAGLARATYLLGDPQALASSWSGRSASTRRNASRAAAASSLARASMPTK